MRPLESNDIYGNYNALLKKAKFLCNKTFKEVLGIKPAKIEEVGYNIDQGKDGYSNGKIMKGVLVLRGIYKRAGVQDCIYTGYEINNGTITKPIDIIYTSNAEELPLTKETGKYLISRLEKASITDLNGRKIVIPLIGKLFNRKTIAQKEENKDSEIIVEPTEVSVGEERLHKVKDIPIKTLPPDREDALRKYVIDAEKIVERINKLKEVLGDISLQISDEQKELRKIGDEIIKFASEDITDITYDIKDILVQIRLKVKELEKRISPSDIIKRLREFPEIEEKINEIERQAKKVISILKPEVHVTKPKERKGQAIDDVLKEELYNLYDSLQELYDIEKKVYHGILRLKDDLSIISVPEMPVGKLSPVFAKDFSKPSTNGFLRFRRYAKKECDTCNKYRKLSPKEIDEIIDKGKRKDIDYKYTKLSPKEIDEIIDKGKRKDIDYKYTKLSPKEIDEIIDRKASRYDNLKNLDVDRIIEAWNKDNITDEEVFDLIR